MNLSSCQEEGMGRRKKAMPFDLWSMTASAFRNWRWVSSFVVEMAETLLRTNEKGQSVRESMLGIWPVSVRKRQGNGKGKTVLFDLYLEKQTGLGVLHDGNAENSCLERKTFSY